jgi:hypothetical protein
VEQQLTAEESELLSRVPENGETVGNVSLMRALGWPPERYWEIRNKLLDKGLVATERGRGGSVRRFEKRDVPLPTTAPPLAEEVGTLDVATAYSEQQLYGPIVEVLKTSWAKDYRIGDHVLEIIANQGPRKTGGIWSRPDIVVVSISVHTFVPGKHLDITTFEIKPYTARDRSGTFWKNISAGNRSAVSLAGLGGETGRNHRR